MNVWTCLHAWHEVGAVEGVIAHPLGDGVVDRVLGHTTGLATQEGQEGTLRKKEEEEER